jgi:hypothetical protein
MKEEPSFGIEWADYNPIFMEVKPQFCRQTIADLQNA